MSMVECLMLRVEGRNSAIALRADSNTQPLTLNSQPRRGVTLLELLIVILIISILAGLILGVASVASETARVQHTRHVVGRLHTLLTEHYDTYKNRRVKLRPNDPSTTNGIETQINTKYPSGPRRGQVLAEARLNAQREMMLMDIPDRWSDVILERVEDFSISQPVIAPLYLDARTELSNVYLRRFRQIFGATNSITGQPNTLPQIKENQAAECLYMVITIATGDGEARTLFGESTIGDTDGDGAPEFLDGWNHPISFLRWAPGFESQIQLDINAVEKLAVSNPGAANLQIAKDRDPFDVFRADIKSFRLVPLIYSAGKDEGLGIYDAPDYVTWRRNINQTITVNNNSPYVLPRLTPYELDTSNGLTQYLGTAVDAAGTPTDTATDNVNNHMLGLR